MAVDYKALVFDFDGVIIADSDAVKERAWPELLQQYGSEAFVFFKEAQEKFGRGKGGDRFDMLRYVYIQLGENNIETLVASSAMQYDEIVQKGILESGVTPETRATLERLVKELPLYINTATPREAIEKTIHALDIAKYFKAALGRPNSKVENFQYIMEKEGIQPEQILFVGDSESDKKASQECGCTFVGFGNDLTNDWLTAPQAFPVISNLNALFAMLRP